MKFNKLNFLKMHYLPMILLVVPSIRKFHQLVWQISLNLLPWKYWMLPILITHLGSCMFYHFSIVALKGYRSRPFLNIWKEDPIMNCLLRLGTAFINKLFKYYNIVRSLVDWVVPALVQIGRLGCSCFSTILMPLITLKMPHRWPRSG